LQAYALNTAAHKRTTLKPQNEICGEKSDFEVYLLMHMGAQNLKRRPNSTLAIESQSQVGLKKHLSAYVNHYEKELDIEQIPKRHVTEKGMINSINEQVAISNHPGVPNDNRTSSREGKFKLKRACLHLCR
jgi:hypothetical protein